MINHSSTGTRRRPLYEIAGDIEQDWEGITPEALQWLEAMSTLDRVSDPYYEDSGRLVVDKFLQAAKAWLGPMSRSVKAELANLRRYS